MAVKSLGGDEPVIADMALDLDSFLKTVFEQTCDHDYAQQKVDSRGWIHFRCLKCGNMVLVTQKTYSWMKNMVTNPTKWEY